MYIQTIQNCSGEIVDARPVANGIIDSVSLNNWLNSNGYFDNYELQNCDLGMQNCVYADSIVSNGEFVGKVSIYFYYEENKVYTLTISIPSEKELAKHDLSFNDVAMSYTLYVYNENNEFAGYLHLQMVHDTANILNYRLFEHSQGVVKRTLEALLNTHTDISIIAGYANFDDITSITLIGASFRDLTSNYFEITRETLLGGNTNV